MAFSQVENSYMDMIAEAYNPTMPPEPELQEEPSLEGLQLAAGPSATRTDAPQGYGEARAVQPTKLESALKTAGVTLEQIGRFVDGIGQVDVPGLGPISLADLIPFVGSAKGDRSVMGTDWQGTPMMLQQLGRGESVKGQPRISSVVGPDGLTYYGTSGSPPMLNADASLAAFDVLPLQQGVRTGARLAVKGAKKAVTELGPTAGKMAEDYMRATGGIIDVAPGKFNPATELPKAIDTVATTPDLQIYLPQAQRAPSVALRLAGVPIEGTGQKGTITVRDVGTILEKSQLSLNKNKPLDPTKPKELSKMVDSATAEAEYQMSQPISGATWYEDDVHQAFMLGSKIVPELATDEPLRVMTTVFSASTSYNKRAGENWPVALRITEHLMKTGKVASRNPDNGKLWGGTTGPIMEQQLKLHEYMIKAMGGMDNYAEWLLTPHTVKEITEMRKASGLYKTPGISGKATDMKMGAFIMGEKGGPFFLNLNGIKETTADKWFTRTYNRHTGTLTTGNVSEQGLVDAPRNEAERAIMKQWNRAVASNIKLDEQANQAVLWYYEQSLYYNLGVKSARSESFSDGAKNLLNARGIPFTDAELAGARNLRNARQAPAEPTGAGGAGNPISVGQTAPAADATVTRGRRAPTKGAQ
jgi:hypothetical protein